MIVPFTYSLGVFSQHSCMSLYFFHRYSLSIYDGRADRANSAGPRQ